MYSIVKVVLDNRKTIYLNDVCFLTVVPEAERAKTTADLDKVFVSINGGSYVKLASVVPLVMEKSNISIAFDYEESEANKTIILLYSSTLRILEPATREIVKKETLSGLTLSTDITYSYYIATSLAQQIQLTTNIGLAYSIGRHDAKLNLAGLTYSYYIATSLAKQTQLTTNIDYMLASDVRDSNTLTTNITYTYNARLL